AAGSVAGGLGWSGTAAPANKATATRRSVSVGVVRMRRTSGGTERAEHCTRRERAGHASHRRDALERFREPRQALLDIAADVHAGDTPAAAREDLEVAGGLRVAQRSEAVPLARDGLVAVLDGQL